MIDDTEYWDDGTTQHGMQPKGRSVITLVAAADSYNLECKIPGMGVSHAILREQFPDPVTRTKVIWLIQLLQLNAEKVLLEKTK